MRILLIGSGGREHALAWKLNQSPKITKLFCAPGSAAIGSAAELVPIAPENIERLADFAEIEKIDLTVVGPELPLTLGIADLFEGRGLKLFGPNRLAAQLEGSKGFAKELLQECRIPTASFGIFTEADSARNYLGQHSAPYVIKADGLAAGKGVLICMTREEAQAAIDHILVYRAFGEAGARLVIEEFLQGEELSFMVLTDGEHALPLASSQDHKRVFDNDEGPNTGGMGAYSPAPILTPAMHQRIMQEVIGPLLAGLRRRGILYRGVIYVGLMLTSEGPKVLEFNARFGDPECQPIMMRLKSDLVPLLEATIAGRLNEVAAEWYNDPAVCVVLTSRGYPGHYETGKEIYGLERLSNWSGGVVFHAGTTRRGNQWFTSGGRVLGVTGRASNVRDAITETYRAVREISWDGMHYRTDIGRRALQ